MNKVIEKRNGELTDVTFEVLVGGVKRVCGGWGLYEQSVRATQLLKAVSEVGKLADSINKGDYVQAKDDVGEILVCLINKSWQLIQTIAPSTKLLA